MRACLICQKNHEKLVPFDHLNFVRNKTQTAVRNMTKKAPQFEVIRLTFRVLKSFGQDEQLLKIKQLSVDDRSTVSRLSATDRCFLKCTIGNAHCLPTVGRLSVICWKYDGDVSVKNMAYNMVVNA